MTIYEHGEGKIGFQLRDMKDKDTFSDILTLTTESVGIGTTTPDETTKLNVDGDVRLGIVRDIADGAFEAAGPGAKLIFSGAPDVKDGFDNEMNMPTSLYRYNMSSGVSALRAEIGKFDTFDKAKADGKDANFQVGYDKGGVYYPVLGVQMDGNVAISDGLSQQAFTAKSQLHVKGVTQGVDDGLDLDDHLVVLQNTSTGGADTLAIHHVNNGGTKGGWFISFRTNDKPLGGIQHGDDSAVLALSGADYAEYLKKADLNETFEKGDIVGIRNGKVYKDTKGAQQILAISSNPIVAGNWPGDDKKKDFELIAFFGQVDTKVLGPVQAGDYIVPSGRNDGTGIAVKEADITIDLYDHILGRAWEDGDSHGINLVNVAIGFNFSMPSLANDLKQLNDVRDTVDRIKAEQDELVTSFESKLDAQKAEIEQLVSDIKKQDGLYKALLPKTK